MLRLTRTQIMLTFLALIALAAPLAPSHVLAAGVVQVPGTPTAVPPRPIIVGRVTGANTEVPQLPTVGPLTFARAPSEGEQQAVPGVEFPIGTQTVYVFFDYDGFAPGGQFEQVWYADGQLFGLDRWAWDLASGGAYQGGLNKPEGLPLGSYRLDIVMNGQVLSSGNFAIASLPAPAVTTAPPVLMTVAPVVVGGPRLGPITFAEGVANGEPLNPGSAFPAGTRILYAIFDFAGMQPDAELTAHVFSGDKRLMAQSSLWDLAESGEGASVTLSNDRGFKPGQYRLALSVGGTEVQSGAFEILSEAVPTATTVPTLAPTATPPPTPAPAATSAPTRAPRPTAAPTKKAIKAKIVYTRVDNNTPSIWVMNLDGSGQQKLLDHASDPTWSPDGSRIAFFGYDGAPRGRAIYQMKADGSGLDVIWNEGTARYLDWSPTGPYLAMTALKSVVVYDGKAGMWRTISKGEEPSFAPDGKRIVAKSCDGGDCGLFVMNRDGADRRRITTSAEDVMPAWSPTGKQIAYAGRSGDNWDIYVMNIDGSGQVRLTDDPGIDAMPAWLPDGSGIVFRSTRGGVWGIWTMNRDGSEPRKIADAPAADDWGRTRLDVG